MDNLPKKYKFAHEFCFFLHDQLVEALISGEKADIFHHRFTLTKEEQLQCDGLSTEELFKWLKENGHEDIVYILDYKQICAALLSDMLHFIYEALQCSKKGKLTVTYALLRKPFKENLFYLEWLLGNPAEFLENFESGNIESLNINKKLTPEERVKIIGDALKSTKYGELIDPQLLYALRFDKKIDFGMEPLFQKANHLITTHKHMETEGQNFNFVFSDHDSRHSQWDHLYTYLPLLLFHAVEVTEGLLANIADRCEGFDLTEVRTMIGFLFWIKSTDLDLDYKSLKKELKKGLTTDPINCDQCNAPITFTDKQLLELYEDYSISCNKCTWSFDLWQMHEKTND